MSDVKIWNIKNINYTNERTMPYALIVLNRPLKFQVDDFLQLWNRGWFVLFFFFGSKMIEKFNKFK